MGGSWRQLLAEGFAGSNLNPSVWTTCYPWFPDGTAGCTNFGNTELEWYTPGQSQVAGGALHLVAQKGATIGQGANGATISYPWTSGMVTTDGHLDFTYGLIQVVARIPRGDGLWPALWLLPQNQSWPPEIDIMEAHGNDPSTVDLTNHPVGSAQQQLTVNTGQDLSSGYHTYAVDWEPGSITWCLNGLMKYRVTRGVPSQPMYFLANLAVDGIPGHSNPDTSTPSNASFDVRSVQIWQH